MQSDMELDQDLANEFIDQILELSADAHVRRRAVIRNSPEFHRLTGEITAYGTLLAVFTVLRRVHEFHVKASEQQLPECVHWIS